MTAVDRLIDKSVSILRFRRVKVQQKHGIVKENYLGNRRQRLHDGRIIVLQFFRTLEPIHQNSFSSLAAIPDQTMKHLNARGVREIGGVGMGRQVITAVSRVAPLHVAGEGPHTRAEGGRHRCAHSSNQHFRVVLRYATSVHEAESESVNIRQQIAQSGVGEDVGVRDDGQRESAPCVPVPCVSPNLNMKQRVKLDERSQFFLKAVVKCLA